MVDVVLIQNFAVALALGALIGLEREYSRYKKRGHEYAGIRTFPLIALTGALCAYFADKYSPYILLLGTLIIGSLILVAYLTINKRVKHYVGATTEVAGFLTFLIGALSYYGEISFAAILAIVITIILYARSVMHNFAKKISSRELADTLKFAVIVFIILPFLPNKGYGPLELFNPFVIWLMVILISGISFVGYIMMKWFGEKGLTLSALLGGLVSSTAVSTSFADRSRKQKNIYKPLALGVILANGIMFIRIGIVTFVLNQELFLNLLPYLFTLSLITALISILIWKKSKHVKGEVQLGSPFTLKPALKFGLAFAAVLALAKLINIYFSSKGIYVLSFVSGITDVDAITVSLSRLGLTSLAINTAEKGVMIAALTNIAVKGGISYWFGRKEFSRIVLWTFGLLIIVGVVMLFLF